MFDDGRNALLIAATNSSPEIIRLVLEQCPPDMVRATTREGKTALDLLQSRFPDPDTGQSAIIDAVRQKMKS